MGLMAGLVNTMVNNALQQTKNKGVPPPPAKTTTPLPPTPIFTGKPVGPYSPLNANVGQMGAEQVNQMVSSAIQPPTQTDVSQSFNAASENQMMGKAVQDIFTPQMIANIMGAGAGAARLGLTAGIEIVPPKPNQTQTQYLTSSLDEAENKLLKFSGDVTKAQEAKDDIDKKIKSVLEAGDTTALQQSIADLVSQTKSISQKVTTARDFFVTKDKNGKETFTKAGTAVIALQILSQFFGNPVQQPGIASLVSGLGERFASEQNKINEANFKAQLDEYNRKLQGYQAQIGVKQAEAKQKLSVLSFESEAAKEKLSRAAGLEKAQLDAVNSFREKLALEKARMSSTQEKAIAKWAFEGLYSGDPLKEAASEAALIELNYPVTPRKPGDVSMAQKEREGKMEYQKALTEELKDKTKRENAKLDLQRRGVVVDERSIDEQIRHNFEMESIGRTNAAKTRGGGSGSTYFEKRIASDNITGYNRNEEDYKAKIEEFSGASATALQNLRKNATLTVDKKTGLSKWIRKPGATKSQDAIDIEAQKFVTAQQDQAKYLNLSVENALRRSSDFFTLTGKNYPPQIPDMPKFFTFGGNEIKPTWNPNTQRFDFSKPVPPPPANMGGKKK